MCVSMCQDRCYPDTVDDIRAVGPADVLADLFEKEFAKYCEAQAVELEQEGTAVDFLGRTKIRTKDRHRSRCKASEGHHHSGGYLHEGPRRSSEETARSHAGSPAG